MRLRPYRPSDKTQIVSLMSEFGTYLEKIDPLGRTEFAPGGSVYFTEKLLKDVNEKNGKVYVAEENSHIIGFIGGYIGKQDEAELMESKKATPGIISEFFVTDKSRYRGVGSELLKELEYYLKSKGCTLVRFDVFAPNQIARDFYAKHGYLDRTVIMSKEV